MVNETRCVYIHKPVRRNFKRNRVIVGDIDQQWQMDVADTQSMQKFNDDYRIFTSMH